MQIHGEGKSRGKTDFDTASSLGRLAAGKDVALRQMLRWKMR